MGNSSTHATLSSGLQSSDTNTQGKKFFTNCICVGCGFAESMCQPVLAAEARCCCLEHSTRLDAGQCCKAEDLCKGRAGFKVGPIVLDAKNPLVDNHELVVVAEKNMVGFSKGHATGGKLQSNATAASGKKLFTNCLCFGCGCSDDMCRPALAGELRCCALESATRADLSQCDDAKSFCHARVGAKVGPLVVDAKNPFVDNHELLVVCEKKIYGC